MIRCYRYKRGGKSSNGETTKGKSGGNKAITGLELVHETPCEGAPFALRNFEGKLLVGVDDVLRLYDFGKKKLLRKAECTQKFPSFINDIRCSGDRFYVTAARMGQTMRRLMAGRLLGMVVEAVFTYVMLAWVAPLVGIGAVPMAALLAILTGLLAFVPNLGALISGALMVLVGFSGGAEMGIYTIAVYFFVQNFDGYVVIPMIAKKTVDLAPALVLAFQLIMGILFGILGLFLADPLLAMIKVALERRAEQANENQTREGAKDGA